MDIKERFKNHVFQWRDELVSRGYDLREIVAIDFTKSTHSLGRCRNFGKTRSILYFSDALLLIFDDEDGYETCKETILHELIHTMPASGRGHGYEFMRFANEFNLLFQTTIGTHCDKSSAAAFDRANVSLGRFKYRVYCDCGKTNTYRTRACRMTRHPEHFFAGIAEALAAARNYSMVTRWR